MGGSFLQLSGSDEVPQVCRPEGLHHFQPTIIVRDLWLCGISKNYSEVTQRGVLKESRTNASFSIGGEADCLFRTINRVNQLIIRSNKLNSPPLNFSKNEFIWQFLMFKS